MSIPIFDNVNNNKEEVLVFQQTSWHPPCFIYVMDYKDMVSLFNQNNWTIPQQKSFKSNINLSMFHFETKMDQLSLCP